jgi:hypothetical protein
MNNKNYKYFLSYLIWYNIAYFVKDNKNTNIIQRIILIILSFFIINN